MIGSILATAVSGINANALRANVAANNIVNQNSPAFQAGRVNTVSVVTEGEPARGGSVRTQVVDATLAFLRESL